MPSRALDHGGALIRPLSMPTQEAPVGISPSQPLDVLPLHVFASGMSTDVLAVIESWAAMPPLPKLDDDDSHLGSPGGDPKILSRLQLLHKNLVYNRDTPPHWYSSNRGGGV